MLDQQGILPDYVAGHSLGEYAALVAAQSLDFADAVRLVRKRGKYMQEAVPVGVGAMAALLKLPASALDGILAEAAQGEVVSCLESEFAGSGRDRRSCRRRRASGRSGQGGRRPARRVAAGQRSVSLLR